MRRILRSRPPVTEETHRTTLFEIFFDLVFVFALTRIVAFMAHPATALTLAQGLILLLLFYVSWTSYVWLGNQVRIDVGVVRAGTLATMAALFVAALVMPDAWAHHGGDLGAPLILALAYIVVRVVQLLLYLYAAVDDRRLRNQLLLITVPTVVAWIPLIVGALLGGAAQTVLWLAALVIDVVGGEVVSRYNGWRLRSPGHFAERHSLVLIIALGESLISVGAGAGTAVMSGSVLLAALLGLVSAFCVWWLYFEYLAPAAGAALAAATGVRRSKMARQAYSQAHNLLLVGIMYLSLGVEEVLVNIAHDDREHRADTSLSWAAVTALYGGTVLYLLGRIIFLRTSVGLRPASPLVAAGVTLLLLPAARFLPAIAALGLLTALLVALVGYERLGPNPLRRST